MSEENRIRNVLITGGSAGIGKAIAQKLNREGMNVLVIARNQDKLDQLKRDIDNPEYCHTYTCDVSIKAQLLSTLNHIVQQWSTLDILVNNAGVFIPGSLAEEEDGLYEQTMRTNVDSAYHTTRAVLPTLSKDAYIFNICSTARKVAYKKGGSFCISQISLLGFTKVLREELKGKIAVSAILPGATLTDSWAGTSEPASRFMKAQDIANLLWTAWSMRQHTVIEEIVMRPPLGDL